MGIGKVLALIILATCCNLRAFDADNEMELFFDDCNCTNLDGSDVLRQINCSLTKANRQRRAFNMEMQFNRDLHKVNMDLLVSLPQRGQKQQQQHPLQLQPSALLGIDALVLFNVSRLNACALFFNRNASDLVLFLRKPLLHYSNFPLRCPLLKQKLYFIRGMRFEAQLLPPLPLSAVIEIAFRVAEGPLPLFAGVTRLRLGRRNERSG